MKASQPHLIWAGKPGCSRPIAELWIDDNELWFTIFVDDNDNKLKVEIFPPAVKEINYVLDFAEVENLIGAAKRDLVAMVAK